MKKKVFLGLSAIVLLGAVAALFGTGNKTSQYQPRNEKSEKHSIIAGAFEYVNSLRANQITGVVNPDDVEKALSQIASLRRNYKASFPLTWQNAGPDNIGGRTRAILVDRNNPDILYAGGVMGGLFKSTNKGASWYSINDKFEAMTVVSICQTPNGTIYFGTGEGQISGVSGEKSGSPGFFGRGIYKSTDGVNFDRILSTNNLTYCNKMAAHPTKNYVLVATSVGLYASDESDDTKWNRVLAGNADDVVFDRNGTAYCATARIYKSTDPATNNSYTILNDVPGGAARMAIAVSHSDPNYVYVIAVGNVTFTAASGPISVGSGLRGIYQSTNKGDNFSMIVGKANAYFAPFTHTSLGSSQGTYDLALAVHPRDRERVFIGGVEWAEWTKTGGPKIIGNTGQSPFNPTGIHADKHCIVFDTVSNPMIMYIGSDGGVTKTTNAAWTNYLAINNGYQTTQFYGIAAGTDGSVLGGTQDQGQLYVNGKGNTPESGVRVFGGDGFRAEISQKDPKILFLESYNTVMARSLNGGGNNSSIWDNRIKESFFDNTEPTIQPSTIFNAPMRLWESATTNENRLFVALDKEIWMGNEAVTSPNPQWFKIADISNAHIIENVYDCSSVFISTLRGSGIYRVDGLNKVTWDTTQIPGSKIADSIKITNIRGSLPSRSITDIEVDQSDPNRVIVTMGNYGNSSFIYITENALDDVPVWRSIQGNLPLFPVYDAEISVENPNHIILGTEFGIYACTNGKATTPTWVENNDNFPLVPVFEMRQVEVKNVTGTNPWRTGPMIYAGTHGRGIFKSGNLLTSVKSQPSTNNIMLTVYPNPTANQVSIALPDEAKGDLEIKILNYSGQVVQTIHRKVVQGSKIDFNVSNLTNGNYIVRIEGEGFKASSKFVKMN